MGLSAEVLPLSHPNPRKGLGRPLPALTALFSDQLGSDSLCLSVHVRWGLCQVRATH